MSQRVRVGVVTGAVGLDGAVKVDPLTDFGGRFAPGATVELAGQSRSVEWVRQQRGKAALVVKVSGVDDRSLAEQQCGHYLEVPIESVPPLPPGRYYHYQLVGLAATTASGRPLGRLVEVLERPANDVWVVRSDGREHLLPATREAVLKVDLEAGLIVAADWAIEIEETG